MNKRFTISARTAYIEQFHQSDLTQTAFCKAQGLALSTFSKWVRDAKGLLCDTSVFNHLPNGVKTSKQPDFIPIQLRDFECLDASLSALPDCNCKVTSSKNAPQHSALHLKINSFSLDISLDLATDYGQTALKHIVHILHHVAEGQDSYD